MDSVHQETNAPEQSKCLWSQCVNFICVLKEKVWKWCSKTGGGEERTVNKNLNFDSETHLLNSHPNDIIAAKNRDLKMLYTLLLSLSTNCKNVALKLTQNTSGKVIATNGSEVCKIGHYYPVIISLNRQSRSISQLLGSLISQSWEKFEKSGKLSFILH